MLPDRKAIQARRRTRQQAKTLKQPLSWPAATAAVAAPALASLGALPQQQALAFITATALATARALRPRLPAILLRTGPNGEQRLKWTDNVLSREATRADSLGLDFQPPSALFAHDGYATSACAKTPTVDRIDMAALDVESCDSCASGSHHEFASAACGDRTPTDVVEGVDSRARSFEREGATRQGTLRERLLTPPMLRDAASKAALFRAEAVAPELPVTAANLRASRIAAMPARGSHAPRVQTLRQTRLPVSPALRARCAASGIPGPLPGRHSAVIPPSRRGSCIPRPPAPNTAHRTAVRKAVIPPRPEPPGVPACSQHAWAVLASSAGSGSRRGAAWNTKTRRPSSSRMPSRGVRLQSARCSTVPTSSGHMRKQGAKPAPWR